MGVIYSLFAFPYVKCGYTKDLPYLKFVARSDGYFVPILHYILDEQYPTLLMSSGNSEDLSSKNIEKLALQYKCNIVRYDYSSRGLHTCKIATEYDCERDIIAVYNYLIKCNINNIFLYGFSLGTYFSTFLASKVCKYNNIKGLILISSFKSLTKVITNFSLPGDFCKTENLASNILCQTLFIHGCHDSITLIKNAIDLSLFFPNIYDFFIVKCGHNKIEQHYKCIEIIYKFIHKIN